jgi:cellulase/cellobiase CelA1
MKALTPIKICSLITVLALFSIALRPISAFTDIIKELPASNVEHEIKKTSEWDNGYCADVTVINNKDKPVDWVVAFNIKGTISSIWDAQFVQIANKVIAEGIAKNNIIGQNEKIVFGFCADEKNEFKPECADGLDNDNDGYIDFPDDPGCEDYHDDEEYNETKPSNPAACSDNIDNDGDGLIDEEDPGCTSSDDNDEYNNFIITDEVDLNFTTTSDWKAGYCKDVIVSNPNNYPIIWLAHFGIEGIVSKMWDAQYDQIGTKLYVEGTEDNYILKPKAKTKFGFCADRQ